MSPIRESFFLIGIDPGTNSCGISLLEWFPGKEKGKVLESFTVTKKASLKATEDLSDIQPENIRNIIGLQRIFRDLLQGYEVDAIQAESPFARFVQTYKVLNIQLSSLEEISLQEDSSRPFLRAEPTTVKKFMGLKTREEFKDKEAMRKALKLRESLSYASHIDVEQLDEHCVDSICIALYGVDWMFSGVLS